MTVEEIVQSVTLTPEVLASFVAFNAIDKHSGFLLTSRDDPSDPSTVVVQDFQLCYNMTRLGIKNLLADLVHNSELKLAGWFWIGDGLTPQQAEKLSESIFAAVNLQICSLLAPSDSNKNQEVARSVLEMTSKLVGLVLFHSAAQSEANQLARYKMFGFRTKFGEHDAMKELRLRNRSAMNVTADVIVHEETKEEAAPAPEVVDLISDDDEDSNKETPEANPAGPSEHATTAQEFNSEGADGLVGSKRPAQESKSGWNRNTRANSQAPTPALPLFSPHCAATATVSSMRGRSAFDFHASRPVSVNNPVASAPKNKSKLGPRAIAVKFSLETKTDKISDLKQESALEQLEAVRTLHMDRLRSCLRLWRLLSELQRRGENSQPQVPFQWPDRSRGRCLEFASTSNVVQAAESGRNPNDKGLDVTGSTRWSDGQPAETSCELIVERPALSALVLSLRQEGATRGFLMGTMEKDRILVKGVCYPDDILSALGKFSPSHGWRSASVLGTEISQEDMSEYVKNAEVEEITSTHVQVVGSFRCQNTREEPYPDAQDINICERLHNLRQRAVTLICSLYPGDEGKQAHEVHAPALFVSGLVYRHESRSLLPVRWGIQEQLYPTEGETVGQMQWFKFRAQALMKPKKGRSVEHCRRWKDDCLRQLGYAKHLCDALFVAIGQLKAQYKLANEEASKQSSSQSVASYKSMDTNTVGLPQPGQDQWLRCAYRFNSEILQSSQQSAVGSVDALSGHADDLVPKVTTEPNEDVKSQLESAQAKGLGRRKPLKDPAAMVRNDASTIDTITLEGPDPMTIEGHDQTQGAADATAPVTHSTENSKSSQSNLVGLPHGSQTKATRSQNGTTNSNTIPLTVKGVCRSGETEGPDPRHLKSDDRVATTKHSSVHNVEVNGADSRPATNHLQDFVPCGMKSNEIAAAPSTQPQSQTEIDSSASTATEDDAAQSAEAVAANRPSCCHGEVIVQADVQMKLDTKAVEADPEPVAKGRSRTVRGAASEATNETVDSMEVEAQRSPNNTARAKLESDAGSGLCHPHDSPDSIGHVIPGPVADQSSHRRVSVSRSTRSSPQESTKHLDGSADGNADKDGITTQPTTETSVSRTSGRSPSQCAMKPGPTSSSVDQGNETGGLLTRDACGGLETQREAKTNGTHNRNQSVETQQLLDQGRQPVKSCASHPSVSYTRSAATKPEFITGKDSQGKGLSPPSTKHKVTAQRDAVNVDDVPPGAGVTKKNSVPRAANVMAIDQVHKQVVYPGDSQSFPKRASRSSLETNPSKTEQPPPRRSGRSASPADNALPIISDSAKSVAVAGSADSGYTGDSLDPRYKPANSALVVTLTAFDYKQQRQKAKEPQSSGSNGTAQKHAPKDTDLVPRQTRRGGASKTAGTDQKKQK